MPPGAATPPSPADAPFVGPEQLLATLTPAVARQAVERLFAQPREAVAVPPRIHLPVPGRQTVGLYMPAATADVVGVKLVHLMPHRQPAVAAEIFLYDAETGALLFWGDGRPLTALRTAAVSLAAARRLRQTARCVTVFGAGVQAAAHLTACAEAYPHLETLRVVARSADSAVRLRGRLPEALATRLQMFAPGQTAEALAGADLVVTTTPAPAPLFAADELDAGALILAVGAATPAMRELPPGAFSRGTVWLDTPQALHEAGDCQQAVAAGWDPASVQGDLFDLLGGPVPAAAPGGTLFKSVGHAAQDLALLLALRERLGF